jgi:hypothetical protein
MVMDTKHDNNIAEYLEEGENSPTNPGLWSRAKAAARAKFTKYPSAYANLYASKWYKQHGGGWRKKKTTHEAIDLQEELKEIILEDLRDWLKQKWKRVTPSGKVAGECGSSKDPSNPDRCLPASKAYSLSQSERAATAKKKKSKSQDGRKQFIPNTKKAKIKSTG